VSLYITEYLKERKKLVLLFHSESTICTAVIIITNYVDISGADRAATTRIKGKVLKNL
jgi:hypothetical protein